mgnify:CR=1 FL=1
MARETPTPWAVDHREILGLRGEIIATLGPTCLLVGSTTERDANSALIVAAVNERAALIAERDRLRAALHRVAFEPIGPPDASATSVLQGCVDIARAALALGSTESEE